MLRLAVSGRGIVDRMYLPAAAAAGGIAIERVRLPHVNSGGGLDTPLPSPAVTALAGEYAFIVSCPPFGHAAYAAVALDQGCRVLCEKPVGMDVHVPLALARMSQRLGVEVRANYQLRFHPAIELVCRILQRHPPLRVRICYRSGARLKIREKPAWYQSRDCGGGLLLALGSHLVELARVIGGEISSLEYAQHKRLPEEFVIIGNYTSGADLQIDCSAVAADESFLIEIVSGDTIYLVDMMDCSIREGSVICVKAEDLLPTLLLKTRVKQRVGLRYLGLDTPWRIAFLACLVALRDEDLFTTLASMIDAVAVHALLARLDD